MNRTRSRTVAALLGATLTTTLAGGPASAKPVDSGTFHDEFADVITDFCEPGRTVDFTAVVDGRFLVNTHGRSGLAFVAEHVSVRQVFTNPETGLSVRTTERTLTKDLRISRNGNLLTIVVLATGNSTVYGPDGMAIARNPGQVRFRVVIDDQGTPTDLEDDVEISSELIKGSTGRSDDFCTAVVPAIT
jgi:hypothetical protein